MRWCTWWTCQSKSLQLLYSEVVELYLLSCGNQSKMTKAFFHHRLIFFLIFEFSLFCFLPSSNTFVSKIYTSEHVIIELLIVIVIIKAWTRSDISRLMFLNKSLSCGLLKYDQERITLDNLISHLDGYFVYLLNCR